MKLFGAEAEAWKMSERNGERREEEGKELAGGWRGIIQRVVGCNFLQVRSSCTGTEWSVAQRSGQLSRPVAQPWHNRPSDFCPSRQPRSPVDDLHRAVNHKPKESRAPAEVNEPSSSATMRKWVGSHNSRPPGSGTAQPACFLLRAV